MSHRSPAQPIHVVYGGAHLFKTGTLTKLSELARAAFETHAPDASSLVAAFGLAPELATVVHARVRERLAGQAAPVIQDYRIDFEDGYGYRPDSEEDAHAVQAAEALASLQKSKGLPPFVGIRIKSFSGPCRRRAERTLRLFLETMLGLTGGALPEGFLVTLPKIVFRREIADLSALLTEIEEAHSLKPGSIRVELMVETPEALQDDLGRAALPEWVIAAQGRCFAAHFGAYDYTASFGVAASEQELGHPACDHARQSMQLSLSRTGVHLSDGATTVMPVGDAASVLAAWKQSYRDIRRSLRQGFYQGWDLHPAQIPVRYVAVHAFFRESLASATARLKGFMDKAAQATLAGSQFDDAATGQGLINHFLRGIACGALDARDALAAGLTAEELATRSFQEILEARGKKRA